jgi:integrase
MSVYKRTGSQTFSYDFEVGGCRFSGDTGATSKREARRIQEVERTKARDLARAGRLSAGRNMTLGDASIRYMLEVGQFHRHNLVTLGCLEWLEQQLGKATRLVDISDDDIARIVAVRRTEVRRVGRAETRTKRVSPATVNRTATEPLRKVLTRARKAWKIPVQEIDWSQHMLAEPRERVREASIGEEAAVMAPLERGYDAATTLMFMDGCRRMEVVGLVWSRIDFFGRQYTVIGKGGKSRTIPMTDDTYDLFWAQRGHHPEAVFTFIAQKTRREHGQIRGQRYPITEHGLRSAQVRAIALSGVQNFRPHDTRHTAATRVLRVSNLKVVKQLLGHEDIATTDKYAHALADDVKAALAASRPTRNPKAAEPMVVNGLKSFGK